MSVSIDNTAYDLTMFDDSYKKQSKDNIYELVNRKKAKNSKLSAVMTIGCLLIIATLLMVQITSYTKLNELNRTISKLKAEYTQLQSDETRLNVKLDSKYNLNQIEDVAVNQYGMHKTDKNSITYIPLHGEDFTKVTQDKGFLSSLGNYFVDTFKGLNVMTEYLK
jgi:cell division protein FtsB